MRRKYRVLILCCGVGHSSKAFLDEGWEVIGIDIDANILEWHNRNMPDAQTYCMDLNTASISEIKAVVGSVDLVVITAPCQGISAAGLFNVWDPRNSLVIRCLRIARALSPLAILTENVGSIVFGRMKAFYWVVMEEMLQMSEQYLTDDRIINGLHLGLPHRRKRWFNLQFDRSIVTEIVWPELNIEQVNNYRMKHVLPQYEYLTYGFHNKNKTRLEKIVLPNDFLPTITATPVLRVPGGANLPIEDVAKACGLTQSWQHPEQYQFAHLIMGNGFMFPMARAFARTIKNVFDAHFNRRQLFLPPHVNQE